MMEWTKDNLESNEINDIFYNISMHPLMNKIDFVVFQYEEQEKGINIKLKNKRDEMIIAVIIFFVVFILEIIFLILKSKISIYFPGVWGIWIGFIVTGITFVKKTFVMIEKVYEFNINNETPAFMKYVMNKGIFTLKAEQRYCKKQISDLNRMLMEIQKGIPMEREISLDEVDYVERRSEPKVFDFYERYKILVNIIAICLTVMVLLS